jgi:hypothetical protein
LKTIIDTYFAALKRTPLDEKTEHTDRGALESLLQAFASKQNRHNLVVHEPGRQGDKGAPDYKVRHSGQIIGYVENKKIDDDLNKVAKGAQIKRYVQLSNNILLTDYLSFFWIKDGKIAERATLAYSEDLMRKGDPTDGRIAEVRALLEKFFSTPPEGIGRSQQLALALATRARLLRDDLTTELVRQEKVHQQGRLFGLYQVFKTQVFQELALKEFADAFAQMLAYGLFLARLNSGPTVVTLSNARDFVPHAFELIRELVNFLDELGRDEYREVRWVVEEVLSIVNGLDLGAIHEDLSFRQRKAISRRVKAGDEEEHRLFERDPFIYFYEDFLRAYDPETKKARGVYYTPPPVVNFIVRAIDDILKDPEVFNLPDGLADNKNVTVLDFACGTGTFLLEVFQQIFANIGGADTGKADPIVRQHLLRNIFGFEYLIAPYTIAHLKLSQYLAEQKHPLRAGDRLQVFLTNTLEPIEPQKNLLLPAVTAEVEAAQNVKDRDILVVTGNPPYAARSKNRGTWIRKQVKAYEFVDGKHFNERKHWLNDDYVKFLRFAQLKVEAKGDGIVGVISNRWWIENVTFRGMRQSLLSTFNQIHIFDLGGEAGSRDDKNVFDITKGVAIALFVKAPGAKRLVRYSSVRGSRLSKYLVAASASVSTLPWVAVEPTSPNYFLVPRTEDRRAAYEGLPSVQEIFGIGSTSILTARDRLAIAPSKGELLDNLNAFTGSASDEEIARRFDLSGRWLFGQARRDLAEAGIRENLVRTVAYRPMDSRYYYDDDTVVFRRRHAIMQHMVPGNVGLGVCRLTKGGEWRHVVVSDAPTDDSTISDASKERTYLFPLYVNSAGKSIENILPAFRMFLDSRFSHHYSPEELLGYIFSILYAPTYRARYAEFLRIGFPRVPFPDTRTDFESLSELGWALIQAQLHKSVPRRKLAQLTAPGDQVVETVAYAEADQSVAINKTQRFAPVPPEVWNFHIGGYQVLEKYLKSRKGRVLSLDEINHVSAIADSLAFTIEQMAKIDKAYLEAFPDRG